VTVPAEPEDPTPRTGRAPLIGEPEKVAIVIVDYDPTWPQRFEIERAKILEALGSAALSVEHIGSTSVPGLAAKAIIDVCVVVADSSQETSYVPALELEGYAVRVREPDWHEHRMLRSAARDVHVHVFTLGSSEPARNLTFRDWLRDHDADRARYEATKRDLAKRDWPTMQHYADAKADVIATILARAEAPVRNASAGLAGRRPTER
jgi:GrpB-like predicted nucleotidyltransferase (UPF0157 family)